MIAYYWAKVLLSISKSSFKEIRMKSLSLFFLLAVCLFIGMAQGFGKKTFFNAPNVSAINRIALESAIEAGKGTAGCWSWYLEANQYASGSAHELAEFLFGSEHLVFSGSLVPNRRTTDILADNFGLPLDYQSIVSCKPTIRNWSVNISSRLSMDTPCGCFYVWLCVPIVETIWDPWLKECVITSGTLPYPAGYFASNEIPRSTTNPSLPSLARTVEDVFRGDKRVGDQKEPLLFGKMYGRQNSIHVADLTMRLGRQCIEYPAGRLDIYLLAAAPTSNRPQAEFLFEELVGNEGRWQLGVGVEGRHDVGGLQCGCYDIDFNVVFDCNISHLFGARQRRSFDFKSAGPGSRYMMLAAVGSPSHDLVLVGQAPLTQYEGQLVPAINYTTLNVSASIGAQVSFMAALQTTWSTSSLLLGYALWARTAEKFKRHSSFPAHCFVLKGDSQLYGFRVTDQTPVLLNISQSKATLQVAQGVGNFVAGQQLTNVNVDTPVLATDSTGVVLNQLPSTTLGITTQQVNGSSTAITLSDADLDFDSAKMPKAFSNTIFMSFKHNWCPNENNMNAYLEWGTSFEFARISPERNSACPQWGIWLGGGISYF